MKRIRYADAKEAARDFDHGRHVGLIADDLCVEEKRLFRKAIPILRERYGYPLELLLKVLHELDTVTELQPIPRDEMVEGLNERITELHQAIVQRFSLTIPQAKWYSAQLAEKSYKFAREYPT